MASEEPPLSLAQLPTCWNDLRLLHHNPFLNLFVCRREGDFFRDADWPSFVKCEMGKQRRDFSGAFLRWCLVSFEPVNGEHPPKMLQLSDFVKDSAFWALFVEVFYQLFLGNDEAALKLVNEQRKRLGYIFFCTKMELTGTCTATPDRVILTSADKIDAAVEDFIKAIPEGDSVLSGYMPNRMTHRKAAPSRKYLEEVARMDRGQARITKTSVSRRKVKRIQKEKNVRRGRRQVPSEVTATSLLPGRQSGFVQTISQSTAGSESASTIDTQFRIFDAEMIIVNNTTNSMGYPSISFESDARTSAPFEGDKREKRKVPPELDTPSPAPPGISQSKKKLKLPLLQGDQGFVLMRRHPENATVCEGSSASSRRRKTSRKDSNPQPRLANGSNKVIQQPYSHPIERSIANFCQPKHGRVEKSVVFPSHSSPGPHTNIPVQFLPWKGTIGPPMQALRPLSTSSEDIVALVEGARGVILRDSKGPGGCDKPQRDTETMLATGSYLEDHALLEKLIASLETDRPRFSSTKPPLPDTLRPSIWAASRQALCETTSWFRCYHGGVYFSDGKVHGYLLGGYASQRDIYCHDGKLIISHGGGKSLEGSSGQHEQDASVRALLCNYREQRPLVLLIDDKYAPFPFDLGYRMYVVLGLYWIVNAWAERDVSKMDGKLDVRIKYKFAFQYCESQGPPWWTSPSNEAGPPDAALNIPHFTKNSEVLCNDEVTSEPQNDHDCPSCEKSTPRIYKQGWMCLYPDCPLFFRINSEEVFSLEYEERFLELRPDPGFGKIDLSLPPPLVDGDSSADSLYSTKGWWCSNCGQLCPREKWECWECSRCNISFPSFVGLPIRCHTEFWDQEQDIKDNEVYKILGGSGITASNRMWKSLDGSHRGLHYVFSLPENRGQIHLIRGHALANKQADDLFVQYQKDALGRKFLRRYPLRFHHGTQYPIIRFGKFDTFIARGRMLTNYFSHNAGAPYKYAATTNVTDPFDRAPPSVNEALRLIKDRVSTVVNLNSDFNEILTAAYMEKQKMSYHTDDEKGLGPVVASLSLGSLAFMHFRQRKPVNHRPERHLTILLHHGDVLVMEGAAIQKLYEHTVVPMNYRIAATARCIDQGSQSLVLHGSDAVP